MHQQTNENSPQQAAVRKRRERNKEDADLGSRNLKGNEILFYYRFPLQNICLKDKDMLNSQTEQPQPHCIVLTARWL